MRVALLAGGTGGAKLAAGMQEEIGAGLTVVANTADDVETLGVHVSPDPDLCTYWLSGEIDEERGWGLRDDTFRVMERMADVGAPNWFSLGDRDLAACLYRREFLSAGGRQTDAQAQIAPRPRGRGDGAADVRRGGPHQGPHRARAARAAGVPDPRRRAAARSTGSSSTGSPRRARAPRSPTPSAPPT